MKLPNLLSFACVHVLVVGLCSWLCGDDWWDPSRTFCETEAVPRFRLRSRELGAVAVSTASKVRRVTGLRHV